MIIPAQVPSTGVPPRTSARNGSASRSRSIPSVIVVDSPPGITSPSSPSRSAGTRTSRGSAPSSRSLRAPLGILALEDPGADEDALGAELHHQRRVGRRRDPAGAEEDDRQLAAL